MFKKFKDYFFAEEDDDLTINEPEFNDEEKKILKSIDKEVVEEVKIKEEQPSTKITLDIIADETHFEKKENKIKTRTQVKRDNFEMPQVISPYFGVDGEEVKELDTLIPSPTKSSQKRETFNSVISPIYGERESKPIGPQKKEESFNKTSLEAFVPKQYEEENDVENVSLDEIVSNENNLEDDLIQFSLFGDNKKIQEEFKNDDTSSSENDDVLPF